MGIFQRLKNFIKKKISGGGSDERKSRAANRVRNYGGGSTYETGGSSGSKAYDRLLAKKEQERKEKKEKLEKAFKAKPMDSKPFDSKVASPVNNRTTKLKAQLDADREAKEKAGTKATPPKKKAYNEKQERILEAANKRKEHREKYNRDTFNERTGHRYDTEHGTEAEKARARQRIKSGDLATDPEAYKYEVEAHKYASSAGRGLASGLSLGLSELAIKKANKHASKEMQEAEEFYQKNKSKGAELAGEMAGSLVTFGGTGGASKELVGKGVTKVLGKEAAENASAKMVEKLAASKAMREVARKEAVRKFGIDVGEEVIEQIARRRAGQAVAELGKDAAINVTTGLVSDLAHSAAESNSLGEFGRNMGINAAMNVGLGAATSLVPALRAGKNIEPQISDLSDAVARNAEDIMPPIKGAKNVSEPGNYSAESILKADADEAVVPPQGTVTGAADEAIVPGNEQVIKQDLEALADEVEPTAKPEGQPEATIPKEQIAEVQPEGATEMPKGTAEQTPSEKPRPETVNDEIRNSLNKEDKAKWTKPEDTERYTAAEAEELKSKNMRDDEKHTRQGATTIAAGMGDRKYKGSIEKAIDDGDMTIEVYHDKENYRLGAQRVMAYAEGKGGTSGKAGIPDLIERFSTYEKGNLPVTSKESREMLYDVLAAVDYANGMEDKELAEKLFLSATKAGAELTSVSGLSLRQWQKIAMSSPDYRAKAVKQQIEAMFNNSRGFKKKYGDIGKQKGFASVSDNLPGLDDFIEKYPEDTKSLKGALDRLGEAKSKDEVEKAASEVILEARRVMPVTAFDQLTQWRYVAMLSSPTTHVKNVVGNIYSGTLGQLSGALSSTMENRLIKSGKVNGKGWQTKFSVYRNRTCSGRICYVTSLLQPLWPGKPARSKSNKLSGFTMQI